MPQGSCVKVFILTFDLFLEGSKILWLFGLGKSFKGWMTEVEEEWLQTGYKPCTALHLTQRGKNT
jgi:hypothetical protein